MVTYQPPYNDWNDRIDVLAQRSGTNIRAVIEANPDWSTESEDPTGSAYIASANIPSAASPVVQEDLRPAAAAIKARMDYQGDAEAYLQSVVDGYTKTGQFASDMSGIETNPDHAAFWDAQVRALTPIGMLWNSPNLGTDLVEYVLFPGRTLDPDTISAAAGIAEAAMRLNPRWYNSRAIGVDVPNVTLRILAQIGVNP